MAAPVWKRRVLGVAGAWLILGGVAHWIGAGVHEVSNGYPSTAEHRIYLVLIGLVQVVAGALHRVARRGLMQGQPGWKAVEASACGLMIAWGGVEAPHVWSHSLPFNLGAPAYFLSHVALACLLLPGAAPTRKVAAP